MWVSKLFFVKKILLAPNFHRQNVSISNDYKYNQQWRSSEESLKIFRFEVSHSLSKHVWFHWTFQNNNFAANLLLIIEKLKCICTVTTLLTRHNKDRELVQLWPLHLGPRYTVLVFQIPVAPVCKAQIWCGKCEFDVKKALIKCFDLGHANSWSDRVPFQVSCRKSTLA